MTENLAPTIAATAHAVGMRLPESGTMLIAAENPISPTGHFTGKLEEPALLAGSTRAWPTALGRGDLPVIARWDFGLAIDSQTIVDTGRMSANTSPCALPTACQLAMSRTKILVRTT